MLSIQGCGINGGRVSSHPYDVRVATPVDAGVLRSIEVTTGSADVEWNVVRAYIGIEPLWRVR